MGKANYLDRRRCRHRMRRNVLVSPAKHSFISCLFLVWWNILKKKKKTGYMRKTSSCLIEGTVHYGREIQNVEFWGSNWSNCIHLKGSRGNWILVLKLLNPFNVDLSTSINLIKRPTCRHVQRLVSYVTEDPINFITKMNSRDY